MTTRKQAEILHIINIIDRQLGTDKMEQDGFQLAVYELVEIVRSELLVPQVKMGNTHLPIISHHINFKDLANQQEERDGE